MRNLIIKKLIKLCNKYLGEEKTKQIIDDTVEKTVEEFNKKVN